MTITIFLIARQILFKKFLKNFITFLLKTVYFNLLERFYTPIVSNI